MPIQTLDQHGNCILKKLPGKGNNFIYQVSELRTDKAYDVDYGRINLPKKWNLIAAENVKKHNIGIFKNSNNGKIKPLLFNRRWKFKKVAGYDAEKLEAIAPAFDAIIAPTNFSQADVNRQGLSDLQISLMHPEMVLLRNYFLTEHY